MTVNRSGTVGDRPGATASGSGVQIDDFGVLRYGDAWTALTPTQEMIMRMLVDRLGGAVGRDELAAAAWPDGGPDPHAIDVHIHKLRPRLQDMGLVIHTLRGRGYLLEPAGTEPARRRR
jgi:DNA-binding winged helix-turn-helix (wHTH) protein